MSRNTGGTRVLHVNYDTPFSHTFFNSFLSNSANNNDIGLYLTKKLVSIYMLNVEALSSNFV